MKLRLLNTACLFILALNWYSQGVSCQDIAEDSDEDGYGSVSESGSISSDEWYGLPHPFEAAHPFEVPRLFEAPHPRTHYYLRSFPGSGSVYPLIEDNWETPGLREAVKKILDDSIVYTRSNKGGQFMPWVGPGERATETLLGMLRYEILPKQLDKETLENFIWDIIEARQERGNRDFGRESSPTQGAVTSGESPINSVTPTFYPWVQPGLYPPIITYPVDGVYLKDEKEGGEEELLEIEFRYKKRGNKLT